MNLTIYLWDGSEFGYPAGAEVRVSPVVLSVEHGETADVFPVMSVQRWQWKTGKGDWTQP